MPLRPSRIWDIRKSKGHREGVPPLFQGTSSATELLVKIARMQPVSLRDLRTRTGSKGKAVYDTADRLTKVGLLYREKRPIRGGSNHPYPHVSLNRDLFIEPALRALLRAIGGGEADESPEIAAYRQFLTFPTVADRKLRYDILFGAQPRTLAITLVALTGFLDGRTIGRMTNVELSDNLSALLVPLTRESIFRRFRRGKLLVYALSDEPWAEPLGALCWKLSDAYPRLQALATATIAIRDGGFRIE